MFHISLLVLSIIICMYVHIREPLERTTVRNAYLVQLCDELQDAYHSQLLDAFGLYVYGMVLKEAQQSHLKNNDNIAETSTHTNNRLQAHLVLMESLLDFPWNWSAWVDLAELCLDDPALHEVVEDKLQPLASHYMYHFFCAHVFGENQAHDNSIAVMDRLMNSTTEQDAHHDHHHEQQQQQQQQVVGIFVQSPYLASRMAVAHYHLREFEIAQECFVALQKRDPYRLEDMDVYSNILCVQ